MCGEGIGTRSKNKSLPGNSLGPEQLLSSSLNGEESDVRCWGGRLRARGCSGAWHMEPGFSPWLVSSPNLQEGIVLYFIFYILWGSV